jgi:hypothetical protein
MEGVLDSPEWRASSIRWHLGRVIAMTARGLRAGRGVAAAAGVGGLGVRGERLVLW